MQYRADIDGLRAVAITLVLLYHLRAPLGGYTGVDVFFTLSGYLITALVKAQCAAGTFSFRAFYVRRARRLLPALHATLVVTLLCALRLPRSLRRATASSVLAAAASLSNLHFYAEAGYFDADAGTKPLLHTWSLSVEEQFYLFWPLLLVALLRLPSPRIPLPAVLALAVASLFAAERAVTYTPAAAFYLPHYRACEFLLGAALAWFPGPLPRAKAEAAVVTGLAAIAAAVAMFDEDTRFPGLHAMLPCVGAALVIRGGATSRVAAVVLANRPAVFVGRISYSLYLTHWPVLVFMQMRTVNDGLVFGEKVVALVLTVCFALALFYFVETPFRRPGSDTSRVKSGEVKSVPSLHAAMTSRGGICSAVMAMSILIGVASYVSIFGGLSWSAAMITLSASARQAGMGPGGGEVQAFKHRDILDALGETFLRYPAAPSSMISAQDPDLLNYEVGSTDPSASQALVIGDSHAGRLLVFAHYLGSKYSVRFHVSSYPGCSPLFGVKKIRKSTGVGQGRVSPENMERCKTLVREWREDIFMHKFSVVFLVSRWSTSIEDGEYFSRGPLAEYRLLRLDTLETETLPDTNASRAVFERSLRQTAREIASSSARVVVMSESPDIGRGSYQCKKWLDDVSWDPMRVADVLGPRARQPGLCTGATRTMALKRLHHTNGIIESLAASEDRVEAIFPSKYFCDNYLQDMRHCRVIWKNKILYRDSDHLSDHGSLYLALRWEADRSSFFPKGWKFT